MSDSITTMSASLARRLDRTSLLLDELARDPVTARHLLELEVRVGCPEGPDGERPAAQFRALLDEATSRHYFAASTIVHWHRMIHTQPTSGMWHSDPDLQPVRSPGEIMPALSRLAARASSDVAHPIVRSAAIVANLHSDVPFDEGYGRVARALFHWSMTRRWPVVFPISLFWSAHPHFMRAGLGAWTDDPQRWVAQVVTDLMKIGEAGLRLAADLHGLHDAWTADSGGRAGSLRRKLLATLVTDPVVDAATAAALHEANPAQFSRVARSLVADGILRPAPVTRTGERGRPALRYEAPEVLHMVAGWAKTLVEPESVPSVPRTVTPPTRPAQSRPTRRGRPKPSQASRSRRSPI